MTMTIEDVLANLDKTQRESFQLGTGLSSERFSTPSTALNMALGGGLGRGRIVTIHGTKSAGKSALAAQIVALAQKEGAVAAWIDAEKSFDSAWMQRLGVNTDELLVSKASDMHKAGDQIKDLCKADIDIIVVDSTSALIQPSYFDKKTGEIEMDNTKKIGSYSMGLKALLRVANFVNEDTLIIIISQESMKAGAQHWFAAPEGGMAIEYYSSQVIRVKSNRSDVFKGMTYNGNIPLERDVGRKVEWTVVFNKLGPQGGTGIYEFYFIGDKVGVDDRLELITLATEYGVLNKAGAWLSMDYKGEEFKIQGANKMIEAMEEDHELYEELKERVELVL